MVIVFVLRLTQTTQGPIPFPAVTVLPLPGVGAVCELFLKLDV